VTGQRIARQVKCPGLGSGPGGPGD